MNIYKVTFMSYGLESSLNPLYVKAPDFKDAERQALLYLEGTIVVGEDTSIKQIEYTGRLWESSENPKMNFKSRPLPGTIIKEEK